VSKETQTHGRRFLKAGAVATISVIVPGLGCERNEVDFRDTAIR
jgi:hypothetical protein